MAFLVCISEILNQLGEEFFTRRVIVLTEVKDDFSLLTDLLLSRKWFMYVYMCVE